MITQANECYFPQPRQGESLKSFLSSQDFDTCAELDRVSMENLLSSNREAIWVVLLRDGIFA